ncbi:ABC transporter substrate-binding protein [Bradyrhizobium yuanmingense]|uniref:ABC transporter substrate-binding protein n=1 Tax=Bradyrhizobium yuanmingense TaxID=108015 RepID=UPI0004B2AE16|nr:ABC transporter substrate-binding protein [Bradyrhizobium yuanmingense]
MAMSFKGYALIGLTGAIGLAASAGVPTYAQEKGAIKIGLMLPYKGVYAVPAESIDRGFQIALEEYGGKINGRRIEIIRADDELTPGVGVQRFNKFVQSDKVDLVAGVVGSNVGIAVSELADKNKMPMVFVNAFADEITGKFCSPYIARTSFSANGFEYASGRYWASKGIKTAVTMGPDYSAGRAFIGGFKRGFEDNGGKVIEEIWTPFQKTKDYSAALTQAANSGAQIIYAFYAGAEAIQVVKQHADFGLRSKIPFIGDHWVYDEALWPALGDLALNAQHVATHYPGIETEVNQKFVKAYNAKYKQDPDVSAALGYDNGKAMLTLETLGGEMPEDRAKFISTMRDLTFDSPRGKIKFNAQNSALLEKVYVVEIVKGPDGKMQRKPLDQFSGAGDLPGCTKSF